MCVCIHINKKKSLIETQSSTPINHHHCLSHSHSSFNSGGRATIYRIAGELYLADWQISCHTANIKSANIAPTPGEGVAIVPKPPNLYPPIAIFFLFLPIRPILNFIPANISVYTVCISPVWPWVVQCLLIWICEAHGALYEARVTAAAVRWRRVGGVEFWWEHGATAYGDGGY